MNLQLFLGYKLIGCIPIDPEAAINPKYLFEKRLELEKQYGNEIANSRSRPLFYVDASLSTIKKLTQGAFLLEERFKR